MPSVSVTEIQLNKADIYILSTFSRSIRANDFGKLRPTQIMYVISLARIEREKVHLVCSVTDGIKINEHNKSIGIGPLYLQTEFEPI